MSSEAKAGAGGSIGFTGMLTILFIGLKLCGVIAWSWWWVLSPLWMPVSVLLGFLFLFGVLWLLASFFEPGSKSKS